MVEGKIGRSIPSGLTGLVVVVAGKTNRHYRSNDADMKGKNKRTPCVKPTACQPATSRAVESTTSCHAMPCKYFVGCRYT